MQDDFARMCAAVFADINRKEEAAAERFRPYKTIAVRPAEQAALDRVLRRVSETNAGCWEWQGAKTAKGYGRFKYYENGVGRLALPHRVVAYAMGKLDAVFDGRRNQCVMHKCDNPKCCRPDHLDVGTLADNMKDCANKGRIPQQARKRSLAER